MAKRTRSNLSGDIGELDVMRKLFEIGSAVNGLTQSDYGWDAHVHTPVHAYKTGHLPESWVMSGLTAHVQIKNSTSGSPADVRVGTLRGWVAGSQVGTPTFFFFVFKGAPRYASPKMLKKYLAQAELQGLEDTAEKPIGKRMTLEADFNTFGYLLRLWTRYPRVLLQERVTIDEWVRKTTSQLRDLEKVFISQVALAWLLAHNPTHHVPQVKEQVPLVLPIIYAGWQELGHSETLLLDPAEYPVEYSPEFLAFAEQTMSLAYEAARSSVPWRWPVADLATSFAFATDVKSSQHEAIALVQDAIAYYKICLERRRAMLLLHSETKSPDTSLSKAFSPQTLYWRGKRAASRVLAARSFNNGSQSHDTHPS
jgi:hypothetical protein